MKRKNRALARIGSKYKGFKDDPEAGPADIGQSSSRATDSGDGQAGGVHDGCTALVSTRLGMGRVDPFQTYARDTNNFENAMIDECQHTPLAHQSKVVFFNSRQISCIGIPGLASSDGEVSALRAI